MRITDVEAAPIGVRLDEPLRWGAMQVTVKGGVLVRIHTDEGLTGLGEAGFSAEYFPTVGPVVNGVLRDLLLGEDPRDLGRLWDRMHAATHMWGRRGIETYALSGIDIALWDLFGKLTGQPVHRLLGTHKARVPAYFAPSLKPASQIVGEVERAAAEGLTAIKLRVGMGLEEDEAIVHDARQAVGDEVRLMVDANMAYDLKTAARMAQVFDELGVAWFEEPIRSYSLNQYVDLHARLQERTLLPLAGGESLLTRYEFIEVLPRRAFDIIQPDCVSVGGISEAKRIADLASAWNLECVPHIACSSGTGVGLAAGLQLICASANAPLIEFDAYRGPGWEGLLERPIEVVDGYVNVPDAPGIGVDVPEDAWRKFRLDQ